MTSQAITIDMQDEAQRTFFTLVHLRGRLKMEIFGMKGRGRSAYAQAKDWLGIKGSREKVLEQIEEMIKEMKGE